ncbi:hypothetical protein E2C01_089255 [Portunus trituberculatus]|uniref:Uncharacterized protein n=1 Tax=Portunus trituberculatus TaxID=210409 RepID=A0A5B7JIA7_PORTR|nr:hypothetical protein [Portunus trituberculatus]
MLTGGFELRVTCCFVPAPLKNECGDPKFVRHFVPSSGFHKGEDQVTTSYRQIEESREKDGCVAFSVGKVANRQHSSTQQCCGTDGEDAL